MVLGVGSCTLHVEYHVILLDGISNLMRTTSERNCLRRESNKKFQFLNAESEKGNGLFLGEYLLLCGSGIVIFIT